MFSAKVPNIDIKNGQFPNDPDFAVFQCIEDLRTGKTNLNDLHQAVRKYGDKALEKTANIENIGGRPEQYVIGPLSRTFMAKDISPLHYAYMTGREDAFRLLLAEGANIDKQFFFQCTSMCPDSNAESKTTCTLMDLFLLHNCQGKVDDAFRTQDNRNAFFISLLQRNRMRDVLKLVTVQLERIHDYKTKMLDKCEGYDWRNRDIPGLWQTKAWDSGSVFAFVPSVAIMKESLGVMDSSYQKMLADLCGVLKTLKFNAQRKEGWFLTYNDEAVDVVLQPLDQIIECVSELHRSLDYNLSHEEYQENVLSALISRDKNYANSMQKAAFRREIEAGMQFALALLMKESDNPSKLLRTIVEMAANRANNTDHELYREAMLDLVKEQVSAYAEKFNSPVLQALSEELSSVNLPVSANQLSNVLRAAVAEVGKFSVEPMRSGLSM